VKAFLEAFEAGEEGWEAGKDLLTAKSVEFFEVLRKKEGKSGIPTVRSFEIEKESAEGDAASVDATVTYAGKAGDTTRKDRFLLRRADGKWRIYAIGRPDKEEDFEKSLEELK
jgi:hypothetical protein